MLLICYKHSPLFSLFLLTLFFHSCFGTITIVFPKIVHSPLVWLCRNNSALLLFKVKQLLDVLSHEKKNKPERSTLLL
ncbi:MAG: hypothetical protein DRP02_08660 [Candidatus Gerdarchaeota archaeon]|nr:MAG: hypothetical protein DRO63_08615 [Candidatus Gerdarchaeota archaeon]RLI70180.1 MAG: hypothetical protein DRP02_08660 [Candidatus Gerdarchaeota archaeon]